MSKKKTTSKRLTFGQRLANKLVESKLGDVSAGEMGDGSCTWVSLNVKGMVLEFSLDLKGEKIEHIGLFKEILEVVDQKKIWGVCKTN